MATKKLDPLISEFATAEDAEAYDKWFRAKVQEAIDDPGEFIPHDEVMARVSKVIADAAEGEKQVRQPGEKLDPLVSEFETEEVAAAHDNWFREQVQESLDDPGELIAHDQVMAEIDAIIDRAERARKKSA